MSNINITFLGTASAQPSRTRNHSSLALRLNGDVWLFDCGEGTQHQIQKTAVKMGRISKVFITHTHGDHIFGLLALLASESHPINRDAGELQGQISAYRDIRPSGTRAYVRTGLMYTRTLLDGCYVLPGRDIQQVAGTWPNFCKNTSFSVSAAPILHSIPCIGYVVSEAPVPGKIDPQQYIPHLKRTGTPLSVMRRLQQGEAVQLSDGTILQGPPKRPGRKIAILGDTCDPSAIAEWPCTQMCYSRGDKRALPGIDSETKASDTYSIAEERSKSPRINAHKLVLNHFSARYAGDYDPATQHGDQRPAAKEMMEAIRTLAQLHFDGPVICARDFMTFDVKYGDSEA
ncbi:beta-lactamase-like protein [Lactifluus volemus]|nr:beta-lactamase-like protein [Lactifluus volemus]